MLNRARKFAVDKRGLAAVEFALIAPVMIFLFFGLVELCNALNAHQKMTSVASTAADLVGQAKDVDASDIADVFAASTAIMTPFPVNDKNTGIVITSIGGSKQRNIGTVLWSAKFGTGVAHKVGESITVGDPTKLASGDTGLLPADCDSGDECTLILAEVKYDYKAPLGKIFTDSIAMSDTFYTKPRRVIAVTCDNCSG